MSKQYDYDFAVVGAGSAGVRAARVAAGLGARTVILENRELGGTCVNVGCVPKKLLVYAAQFSDAFTTAEGFGWRLTPGEHDWALLRERKNQEIERLNRVYESLLDKAGAELISGRAELSGPHSLRIGEREITAEHILLAPGGWPRQPKFPGADLCITSNEVFSLEALPKRVLIEGGGYIAVEFAGIFNGLGAEVELVYRGPRFMKSFDEDLSHFLAQQMRAKGINISFNTQVSEVRAEGEERVVRFADGREERFDLVMSAIGRVPLTQELGLEHTRVQRLADGSLRVNERLQTDEPSIYAAGDVVGRLPLTPVALKEGEFIARQLFGGGASLFDYDYVATAVFSQPEVATCGLTETAARARGFDIKVFKTDFRSMKHSLSGLAERTLMKLVVDRKDDRVLGCHMVGEGAAEIMQGLSIALNMGATKADFDRTLGIHPTAAEEFVTLTREG